MTVEDVATDGRVHAPDRRDGTPTPRLRWVSQAEGRALFEGEVRAALGISREEFLRRWDAGEYDAVADDPDHPEIMRLASLIPFGR